MHGEENSHWLASTVLSLNRNEKNEFCQFDFKSIVLHRKKNDGASDEREQIHFSSRIAALVSLRRTRIAFQIR